MPSLKSFPSRPVSIILSILYFSGLAYLVFFARRRRHIIIRSLNLVPVKSTIFQYHHLSRYNFWYDFFGNIFVFLPVCFAFKTFFPAASIRRVIWFGFLLSVSIEVLQYIFEVGYSEIDDVILNTLGTVLGALLCRHIARRNVRLHTAGE